MGNLSYLETSVKRVGACVRGGGSGKSRESPRRIVSAEPAGLVRGTPALPVLGTALRWD